MTEIYIPHSGGLAERRLSLDEFQDVRTPYTGKMKYLHSVSELKMVPPSHKGCPRKWALMYLAKLPKIPNQALIDGILLHQCINEWFAGGRDAWTAKWMTSWLSQTGREMRWYAQLAQAVLRHVPDTERAKGISEATYFFEIPELDTALYIKPDWLTWKRFRDWKSSAATTKTSPWVLQQPEWWLQKPMPEDRYTITNDIQSRVYAHGLMQLLGWDVIDASWVYGSKKFKPSETVKTWTCEARFERDETRRWVETNVWPMIEWMNHVKDAFSEGRIDSPLLVPHNSKACEGIGKFCDAFSTCRLYQSPIPLRAVTLPVIQR